MMHYHILAADYDGTLAKDGIVADSTVEALRRLRDSGRKVLLVTGRRLEPVLDLFPDVSLFDLIVAENGALLFDPESGEETLLADPPPPEFVDTLRQRGVDRLETGRCIVATWQPFETISLEVIQAFGLDLQIIFNKDAVMLLPSGVNKATGLAKALHSLGYSPHNAVSVGDAENDAAMMRSCSVAVAVENALPSVKEMADIVLSKPRGEGVEELIDRIIQSDLAELRERPDRQLAIGSTLSGQPFSIPGYGDSVLVTGGPGGGKSRFAISVMETLTERGEQCCVIDPEGDYQGLDESVALGTADRAPEIEEVIGVLEQPDDHCIVSFFGIKKDDRPEYFNKLFRALAELRSRTGRPHWIIVDEAHYAAPKAWQPAEMWSGEELAGFLFLTAYHDQISPAVMEHVDWIISIAKEPQQAIQQCCEIMGEDLPDFHPPEDSRDHRALAWRRGDGRPQWFSRLSPRSGGGQRHQHSYYEGDMDEDLQFVFRGPDDELSLSTANLKEFIKTAKGVDDGTWTHHLRRHDYSSWFRDIIRDDDLAAAIEDIERTQDLTPEKSRELIADHIHERFKPQW
ncbi:HAD family hydrolase [Allorhodopirellula solitaria]|uniref:Sugar phosphatase YidA n=1 Tax=Allorhodopirellula solitaria TaxID=2527987 RepID=A0A5C5X014_9BACT|nr:HAD family hydrolase [Allorhodopirellula solitaria]TWT55495.1 Sugar phosphatase YidA [Allorhodopirellula solitaria]